MCLRCKCTGLVSWIKSIWEIPLNYYPQILIFYSKCVSVILFIQLIIPEFFLLVVYTEHTISCAAESALKRSCTHLEQEFNCSPHSILVSQMKQELTCFNTSFWINWKSLLVCFFSLWGCLSILLFCLLFCGGRRSSWVLQGLLCKFFLWLSFLEGKVKQECNKISIHVLELHKQILSYER